MTENAEKFITTPTVQLHLKNLARAVLLRKYPILLQGPTSSGKTSLITHLASVTGHKCIRINNHEHTDIQEYIGFYISDSEGRLVFNEGPLVQALRQGHWVILDELNLAPSEVLEALNRLLDDNRELFVPELQEVVKPDKNFMLFATQNPPGIYAGRKSLSRAFRSRFLELHVDDIPDVELHEIIEKRCSIAPSYAKRMIAVMRELQRRRSAGNLFAGRHGYITPRDLFRWANRPATSYSQLAFNGFFVLGERLRSDVERQVVLQTLQRELKTKVSLNWIFCTVEQRTITRYVLQICPEELYLQSNIPSTASTLENIGEIVWTPSFKRMCVPFQDTIVRALESEQTNCTMQVFLARKMSGERRASTPGRRNWNWKDNCLPACRRINGPTPSNFELQPAHRNIGLLGRLQTKSRQKIDCFSPSRYNGKIRSSNFGFRTGLQSYTKDQRLFAKRIQCITR